MKDKVKNAFSLHHDTADYDEIRERITSGGQVTGTNLCILMLAILIASIGLNMNSTAVIIGAMLISPLMGSIQAMGYGVAVGDTAQFKRSGIGFLFQMIICLVTSTLYFLISPISTQTSELLARTQPNIWDVLIAICGGLAGMIGMTRKERSNVIPGVAIATALMPPLCTCGYGIAHGSLHITLGAGLLFLVNAYFILLTSVLVLIALKVPQKGEYTPQQLKRIKWRMILTTVIILIPCLAVAGLMVKSANEDSTSVTGFETVIPVENVTNEIKILFPEVVDIKVGTLESVGNDGDVISETSVLVYLHEEMDGASSGRMERWLNELYGGSCKVIFIYE
ncbi:MAG: TIGR00341 family protein [Huintestinicola sp.]